MSGIDTIRFYEKARASGQHSRSEGGFRLFGDADVERLKFIRNAQELGFSLVEIKELLALQGEQIAACSHVQELLEHKLAVVHEKIEDLTKLEAALKRSLRSCRRKLNKDGDSHAESCPVPKEIERPAKREKKP